MNDPYGKFDPNNHWANKAVGRANYEQKKMRRIWDRADGGRGDKYNDGWDRIWGNKDAEENEEKE